MGKWIFPLAILGISALLSACSSQTVPAIPTAAIPASSAGSSPTVTASLSTINGAFVRTNTSAPGMKVGVETMAVLLEYRLSTVDQWEKVDVDCSFDRPAPVVLRNNLVGQYECRVENQSPGEVELRTTAEVKVFGKAKIFKLEVESP